MTLRFLLLLFVGLNLEQHTSHPKKNFLCFIICIFVFSLSVQLKSLTWVKNNKIVSYKPASPGNPCGPGSPLEPLTPLIPCGPYPGSPGSPISPGKPGLPGNPGCPLSPFEPANPY